MAVKLVTQDLLDRIGYDFETNKVKIYTLAGGLWLDFSVGQQRYNVKLQNTTRNNLAAGSGEYELMDNKLSFEYLESPFCDDEANVCFTANYNWITGEAEPYKYEFPCFL